jgi:small subunit ribosomal protein S1
VGNWDEVSEGQIIEVNVTGANKGGLECQVAGIRGFIPMGQVSIYRVENPEELVGQRLACVVTEANRDRRNLVLSHRAVMERERNELRDKMLAELAPGQIREGIVRSMKDFGAFVDLGGVDGLVHVSQLSWDRVKHPSEVLEVGQKIKVRVEKFDKDTGKVSLSYREVGTNPWQNVESQFPVGSRATGPVSRVMDFGAFVKLAPGVEGLIHISELAHGRVFRVSDVLSEGQEVEVKILSVDSEKQRISLSLKALMEPPVKPGQHKLADEDMPLPADAPKPPKKHVANLKGGIGGPSGGEKFGLNW